MSRFLNIIENNLPDESRTAKSVVVGKLAELLDTIPHISVSSIYPDQIEVGIEGSKIRLKIVSVTGDLVEGEEDGEDSDVYAGAKNLASNPNKRDPNVQKATKATSEYDKAAVGAVDVVAHKAASLKKAVDNARANQTNIVR